MPPKPKLKSVETTAVQAPTVPQAVPTAFQAIPGTETAPQPVPVVDPNAPAEFALDPHDAALVQLGSERMQNAQLHLQNRKNEFDGLLMQVRAKYEENGKYTMTSIDIGRGAIIRAPRA